MIFLFIFEGEFLLHWEHGNLAIDSFFKWKIYIFFFHLREIFCYYFWIIPTLHPLHSPLLEFLLNRNRNFWIDPLFFLMISSHFPHLYPFSVFWENCFAWSPRSLICSSVVSMLSNWKPWELQNWKSWTFTGAFFFNIYWVTDSSALLDFIFQCFHLLQVPDWAHLLFVLFLCFQCCHGHILLSFFSSVIWKGKEARSFHQPS